MEPAGFAGFAGCRSEHLFGDQGRLRKRVLGTQGWIPSTNIGTSIVWKQGILPKTEF